MRKEFHNRQAQLMLLREEEEEDRKRNERVEFASTPIEIRERELEQQQEEEKKLALDLSPLKEAPTTPVPAAAVLTKCSSLSDLNSAPGQLTPKCQDTTSQADSMEQFNDESEGALREMKLKGEFPCRVCKIPFANLRALKGHNKELSLIHI